MEMEPATSDVQSQTVGRTKPKIPVELMVPIFSFLSTSDLMRFVSDCAKKPLGAFWSVGLKIAVEQRLPFSLEATAWRNNIAGTFSTLHLYAKLYDCNRDKLADVKRPVQFRASALCDLTEDARISLTLRPNESRYVLDGQEFEGILSNLRTLTLILDTDTNGVDSALLSPTTHERELFSSELRYLLQQLQSLTIIDHHYDPMPLGIATDFRQMTALRTLDVSTEQFLVLATVAEQPALVAASSQEEHADVLSQLDCLKLLRGSLDMTSQLLQIISAQCTGLRAVFFRLRCGDINSSFRAFRALPLLSKVGLGLNLRRDSAIAVEIAANENVPQVIELLLKLSSFHEYRYHYSDDSAETRKKSLFRILSNFRSVEKLSIKCGEAKEVMQLTAEICRARILPQLKALKCFTSDTGGYCSGRYPDYRLGDLRLFLLEPSLPREVDLSPIVFHQFAGFSQWAELYRMMQENPIVSLSLCGPFNPTALRALREEAAADPVVYEEFKIVAWRAKRRGGDESVPTDFKISGKKNGGIAGGQQFTLRFFHPLEKSEVIF